ncbi:hypothetical protein Lac1_25290 [Claveliimonas bilis]|uniref:Uncharacterized protein n=1 Tax=Claveliimonas bilis TaxID=3028070 RepID=A0ABM8ICF3_9FIRM|nr:hypothetical protein Lac1_25290 [Claveliimonas bilis]
MQKYKRPKCRLQAIWAFCISIGRKPDSENPEGWSWDGEKGRTAKKRRQPDSENPEGWSWDGEKGRTAKREGKRRRVYGKSI